jgi:hypothetical protein
VALVSLELDLIDRVAQRGDLRTDLRPLPIADSNFTRIRTSINGQDNLRQRTLFIRPKVQSPVFIKFREDNHDQKPLFNDEILANRIAPSTANPTAMPLKRQFPKCRMPCRLFQEKLRTFRLYDFAVEHAGTKAGH